MLSSLSAIRNSVIYENKLYFVAGNYGKLFFADMVDQWKIESVCELPWRGTADCFLLNNKIWCVAMKGMQLISYEIDTKNVEYYTYGEVERENVLSLIDKDFIWIFPRDLPDALFLFSIRDKKFSMNFEWEKGWGKYNISGHALVASAYKKEVIMSLQNTRLILKFDIDEGMVNISELPIVENIYGVAIAEEGIYVTTNCNRNIYLWEKNHTVNKIWDEKGSDTHFGKPIYMCGKLLLMDGNRVEVFADGTLKHLECIGLENKQMQGALFFAGLELENRCILFPWNANFAIETSKQIDEVKIHKMDCPLVDFLYRVRIIVEGDTSLFDFINAVQHDNKPRDTMNLEKNGNAIYWRMRE